MQVGHNIKVDARRGDMSRSADARCEHGRYADNVVELQLIEHEPG